ncbi:MAG: penicillin acylase family protein [Terriglobia bacterium]|jgi:acyl-homoserine lactone acylase PvdQ
MDRRDFLRGVLAGSVATSAAAKPHLGSKSISPASQAIDPLAEQVTIYRDEFGVPHIVGETEEATFFGYGYAQAQDHLEKMMAHYLDAQGRLAEIRGFDALGQGYLHYVGPPDSDEYRWDGDYLQRLLRTKKGVVENKGKIDPQTYVVLRGFARGVNAYIEEHRGKIPRWIEPITPEDVEAEERSHYFRFYSVNEALIKLTNLPRVFPNLGSDQFAIAPQRSTNGHVIHFEETHMPWANRFQNYEAHLITPGKLYAGGISWFGSPFFLDGFNDRITWSATWNFPNIADVYEEKLNPQNPLQYLYEGEWKSIQVENETFKIKGPSGLETITLPCYYTHHGPIVKTDRAAHRAYSIKLPNFDGVNYSTGMYRLMKSQNLEDFKSIFAEHLIPRWNYLYSDKSTIYWVDNAAVAVRAPGYDWREPVPGWTKETEWGPYFPLEKMPQLLNPPSGFIQNCNNPPWLSTVNSGLDPLEPAPYYQMEKPQPYETDENLNPRGERLLKLLSQNKTFTVDDIKNMVFDSYVVAADVIVPLLVQAYSSPANPFRDSQMEHAIEVLKAWSRYSAEDSIAQTYLQFWGRAYEDLFSHEKFSRFIDHGRYGIRIDSAEEQAMALRALREAINRIQADFGKADVPWGQVNLVVRGGEFPMDGAAAMFDVLHPDSGEEQDDGRIHDNDGWGHILVVVESDPKEIWSLLPYGESEDPRSLHYNDLAKLHSKKTVKRFWFTPGDIRSHAESVWGDKRRIDRLIGGSPA